MTRPRRSRTWTSSAAGSHRSAKAAGPRRHREPPAARSDRPPGTRDLEPGLDAGREVEAGKDLVDAPARALTSGVKPCTPTAMRSSTSRPRTASREGGSPGVVSRGGHCIVGAEDCGARETDKTLLVKSGNKGIREVAPQKRQPPFFVAEPLPLLHAALTRRPPHIHGPVDHAQVLHGGGRGYVTIARRDGAIWRERLPARSPRSRLHRAQLAAGPTSI